ncbi:MAG TPA: transposase [Pseudonocardiaceae bacterium]|nr:transposase [Pseudonocardiaceae bacterium]
MEQALSTALSRSRRPTAIHDPAKILCDLAITVALGGDCLTDIASLRAEPDLLGLIASDPTVARLIDSLAHDEDTVLAAMMNTARAQARGHQVGIGLRPRSGEQCPQEQAVDPQLQLADVRGQLAEMRDRPSDLEDEDGAGRHRAG